VLVLDLIHVKRHMHCRLIRRPVADVRSHLEELEAALASCEGWDAKYQVFEEKLRFTFYGEPKPPPVSAGSAPSLLSSRFYPKLKPLREALLQYERHHGVDTFDVLIPGMLQRAHCADTPEECAPGEPSVSPLRTYQFARTTADAWLCHAMLLNTPHGSPLDFYGGGKDPIFVSGARLAVQKILCLLALVDPTGARRNLDGELDFRRVEMSASQLDASLSLAAKVLAAAAADATVETAVEAYGCQPRSGMSPSPDPAGAVGKNLPPRPAVDALVLASSAVCGGGQVRGNSAGDEEAMCLCFGESLLALALFPQPMRRNEAILLTGCRRTAHASGLAHTFTFCGRAEGGCCGLDASPTSVTDSVIDPRLDGARLFLAAASPAPPPAVTLIAIDAASPPGLEQFVRGAVVREVRKAAVGFIAMSTARKQQVDGEHGKVGLPLGLVEKSTPPPPPVVAAGLWGCGGFRGGQPLLRILIQLLGAAAAGAVMQVRLPPGHDPKFYRGVLAEISKQKPTVEQLLVAVCLEAVPLERRLPRLAVDVPAYGSHLIRSFRGVAPVKNLPDAPAGGSAVSALVCSGTVEGELCGGVVKVEAARSDQLHKRQRQ
jgi:hypothetical protein